MTLHTKIQERDAKWLDICAKQAEKMDKFSPLQRSGIAGTFEIEGKYFNRTSSIELLTAVVKMIEGEKRTGAPIHNKTLSDLQSLLLDEIKKIQE